MVSHFIPDTLQAALHHLASGKYKVIAGGTDLMIQYRNEAGLAPRFDHDMMYLFNLKELNYIRVEDGYIKIGAMTPLEDVLESELVPEALRLVIHDIASPGIRHMATIAGNIGNASPAGDSLVALYLLDASITLMKETKSRTLPIDQVILGVRKTVIGFDELIGEISFPLVSFDRVVWNKVGGRRADAISKISFLGAYKVDGSRISDVRIALGAISPTIVRSKEIERRVMKLSIHEIAENIESIIEGYIPLIRPIDDQRSTAKYRKTVAINLIRDFIEKIG